MIAYADSTRQQMTKWLGDDFVYTPQVSGDLGDRMLAKTLAIAERLNLGVHLLPKLHDIDRPEDLVHWDHIQQNKQSDAKVSVIIPCLNEEANIEKSILSAQQQPNVEIIVVDGGSQDRTMKILRNIEGIFVVSHPSGRARQMNRGADLATGDTLLFLHADTILPENYPSHIFQMLNTAGVAAGAFRLKVDLKDRRVRVMERLVHWRSTLFQMPYGDQGIFVKTSNFRRVGGFPDLPIMEDYELVRKLRKMGDIRIAETAVVTSGRRWERLGIFHTTRINWLMVWKYRQGACPEALWKWYRSAAQSPK